MQAIVVSNTESLRTQYFIKAGQSLGIDTAFVSYDDLLQNPALHQGKLVKLEPPFYEESELARYNILNNDYREFLSFLKENKDFYFLNSPEAILKTLDKLYTKQLLKELRQTPVLNFEGNDLISLMKFMDEMSLHSVFIKPRFGSGAGGIIALRKKPGGRKLVAYTSLKKTNEKIFNTKQINRLTGITEITVLVNFIMQAGALVEEWVAKESFMDQPYDLRVVCQFGEVKHIVVRCSKGAITNLHLNNNAVLYSDLQLSESCISNINEICVKVNDILGLSYSGIDVLIAKGTETPYIIEVNGQGDHIYQDIFDKNLIYKEQLLLRVKS